MRVCCATHKSHTLTIARTSTPQELRIEAHDFGAGTPVALLGLRCMVRPTDAECDAASAVLLAAKNEADKVRATQKASHTGCGAWPNDGSQDADQPPLLRNHPQPRAVIAGTLANVTPATPESVIVLTSGTTSPSHDSDDEDLDVNFDTPLPVFEDRGGPVAAQPASQSAPASVGAIAGAPHATPEAAPQPASPPGHNWWEPAPHGAPHSAPHAGPGMDAPRSSLHHEILAFAHAATPSQVGLVVLVFVAGCSSASPTPHPLDPRLTLPSLSPPHTHPSSLKTTRETSPLCAARSKPSPALRRGCGPSRAPSCLAARRPGWRCPGLTWTSSCWARPTSWPTRPPGSRGEC